jgi:DNA repair protein RadA/Sms
MEHRRGRSRHRPPRPRRQGAGWPECRLRRPHRQRRTPPRAPIGIAELDRALGGGLVPASVVLVGGDPGIGKSTLLLQAAARLARSGRRVLYVTGEESIDQIRLRARRLGVANSSIELAAAINVRDIAASLEQSKDTTLVVIDSIQTMWLDAIESAPGTVAQVRACSFELIRLAKSGKFALVLVGHVTKDGAIAGPRVLEHMVDAVLYFEGDRGHQFRILRAVKNRFGATDEIGVFEMTDRGLAEVANPSALFLAERRGNIAGSAVFAGLEGTRPVLVEVQALLSPNPGGSPRRSVIGWDGGRLAMLLAVLETRAGCAQSDRRISEHRQGLRVNEPRRSCRRRRHRVRRVRGTDQPGIVYFGEVGLSGDPSGRSGRARLGSRKLIQRCHTARAARGNRKLAPRPKVCEWKSATSPIWLHASPQIG